MDETPRDAAAPDAEVIGEAVRRACHAPSLHNSQPWRWAFDGTALHLCADFGRFIQATDRAGRELMLSCGAVLDHLRVAMAGAGWDSVTARFPDAADLDHLAGVRFHRSGSVTEAQRRRSDAILRRWTDRLPFAAPAGWPRLEALLRDAVEPYEVKLDVIRDGDRQSLAEASRLTESVRHFDVFYQDELRWWTSPFGSGDRIPQDALVSSSEAARVDIGRVFPPGAETQHGDTIDHDCSKVVVLSTGRDDPLDVLRCGEALSAVLLDCTLAGMATCTLTHMIEFAPSRDIVREIVGGDGLPQLLVRVGESPATGHHITPAPRRPLADVLEFRRYPGGAAPR